MEGLFARTVQWVKAHALRAGIFGILVLFAKGSLEYWLFDPIRKWIAQQAPTAIGNGDGGMIASLLIWAIALLVASIIVWMAAKLLTGKVPHARVVDFSGQMPASAARPRPDTWYSHAVYRIAYGSWPSDPGASPFESDDGFPEGRLHEVNPALDRLRQWAFDGDLNVWGRPYRKTGGVIVPIECAHWHDYEVPPLALILPAEEVYTSKDLDFATGGFWALQVKEAQVDDLCSDVQQRPSREIAAKLYETTMNLRGTIQVRRANEVQSAYEAFEPVAVQLRNDPALGNHIKDLMDAETPLRAEILEMARGEVTMYDGSERQAFMDKLGQAADAICDLTRWAIYE